MKYTLDICIPGLSEKKVEYLASEFNAIARKYKVEAIDVVLVEEVEIDGEDLIISQLRNS